MSVITLNTCSDCGACVEKCPKKAITINHDELGFPKPEINQNLCIECGLCQKVCPHLTQTETEKPLACYFGTAKDSRQRKASSSGGLFAVLAKYVLSLGNYVVFGAVWDGLKVVHSYAETIEDLKPIYRTKYVLSDMKGVYRKIEEFLRDGKRILFSGTPCQNQAVKNFFSAQSDRIIFIDILCHGTPSQELFSKFMDLYGKRNKGKVRSIEFRAKTKSDPNSFAVTLEKDSGRKVTKKGYGFELPYSNAFKTYACFMPACYQCPFASPSRCTDITIGDAWTVERLTKKLSTKGKNKGCSCIIVNTEKGKDLFEAVKGRLDFFPIDQEYIEKTNQAFSHPETKGETELSKIRKALADDFENTVAKKYTLSKKAILKVKISNVIPTPLRDALRPIYRLLTKR